MAENPPISGAATNRSKSFSLSGLKNLAMRGAVWTFAGYGAKQVIRFVNNIILTRLLMPDLFGAMAIVNTFILGLNLFSDIGINFNIIQSKRGNDPVFLNTAWTLQVIRGLLLATIAFMISGMVAVFYEEPLLRYALPAAGLTAVFQGFASTKKSTANRDLQMLALTGIELISYIVGIAVMLTWAYLSPSIWALVAGSLVTSFIEMVLTHVSLKGHNPRFQWDQSAFKELFRFGSWIIVSSSLTFLTSQSDRLIIGKVIDLGFLGVFFVAAMFAGLVRDAIRQLGYKVLLPSYSTLERDNPKQLYAVLRQSRIMLIVLSWCASIIFILLGQWLINLLYDELYADAGWILQILALGTLVGVVGLTYDTVLVAKGKTSTLAALSTVQLIIQLAAMFIGASLLGARGVVIGIACVGWLVYPFKAFWLSRLDLWQPEVDLPVIALAIAVVAATVTYLL